MPQFTDITGLAGVASAMAASVLLLPGIARLSRPSLAVLLSAVFVLSLIPFGGMPLAAYVRGATGDLSITTLVLLWCALLRRYGDCVTMDAGQRNALLILVAVAAIVFYPLALGIGPFDPYRLGFGDPAFVVVLLLLAAIAWLRKNNLIVLCIALAVFAWSLGWYESGNLWDYLVDPFVAIYALCVIAIRSLNELKNRLLENA